MKVHRSKHRAGLTGGGGSDGGADGSFVMEYGWVELRTWVGPGSIHVMAREGAPITAIDNPWTATKVKYVLS